MHFNTTLFATALRQKRAADRLTLRQVAVETGISASTIGRIETGKGHDLSMMTFITLCNWLQVSPDQFFVAGEGESVKVSTIEQIETLLRGCPEIPEFCRAVAEVLRLARNNKEKDQ